MQVLFHLGFSPGDPGEIFELICENFNAPYSARAFARELVLGVCERQE